MSLLECPSFDSSDYLEESNDLDSGNSGGVESHFDDGHVDEEVSDSEVEEVVYEDEEEEAVVPEVVGRPSIVMA
ncbi:UNVERIFIED_CONTAM: hypothetical protein Sradi_2546800 [Sesamum radiatum]|uniref:Uncharacterized protein n=1 Tax=Sesamum radiatum TaxID=300843 RepID=A0AAW2SMC6_SESRA